MNFEHISHLFSSVSIVDLEQVNVSKLFIAKTLVGGLNGANVTG